MQSAVQHTLLAPEVQQLSLETETRDFMTSGIGHEARM